MPAVEGRARPSHSQAGLLLVVSSRVAEVGESIARVSLPVASVGYSLSFVGAPVAFVSGGIAQVGRVLASVALGFAQVGEALAFVEAALFSCSSTLLGLVSATNRIGGSGSGLACALSGEPFAFSVCVTAKSGGDAASHGCPPPQLCQR